MTQMSIQDALKLARRLHQTGDLQQAQANSSLTGIVFGLWPARQAAHTNPIEALRAG